MLTALGMIMTTHQYFGKRQPNKMIIMKLDICAHFYCSNVCTNAAQENKHDIEDQTHMDFNRFGQLFKP